MMRQFIALCMGLLLPCLLSAQTAAQNAVAVISAEVTERDMAPRYQFTASVRSEQAVVLKSPVAEQVIDIHFMDGQQVKAGDLLVSLQQSQEKAAIKAARAQLLEAQANFDRVDELRQQAISSQAEWDLARAAVQAAEAELDDARAELAERQIRAPFDGVLGLRQIALGDFLSSGDVITNLLDPSQLQIEFELPGQLLGLWDQGVRLEVTIPDSPNSSLEARPLADAGLVNPQTRQLQVRAQLPASVTGLRPGQLALVSLSRAQSPTSIAIPEAALVAREDRKFVFVIEDELAQQIEVQIGQRREGWVSITDGLNAGQTLVVHGQNKLRDGSRIRVRGHYDGRVPMAELLRQDNS